jgi:outer membrane receptor protein involved in Fe transport
VTQKPALTLQPERLETFEVALERRVRPGLKASLSLYHTRVEDLVGLVTDPADDLLVYTNGDAARSTGVEAGLEGQITSRLFARASYAFQQAEEGPEDLRPVGSPRHVAHLATSLSLLEGQLVPGLEVYYLGARPTLAGAQAADHALAGLILQVRPKAAPRLELLARVGNLLDTEYPDPGGEEHRQDLLVRDGRTAWLSVRLRF